MAFYMGLFWGYVRRWICHKTISQRQSLAEDTFQLCVFFFVLFFNIYDVCDCVEFKRKLLVVKMQCTATKTLLCYDSPLQTQCSAYSHFKAAWISQVD